jgi:hypothetical protein
MEERVDEEFLLLLYCLVVKESGYFFIREMLTLKCQHFELQPTRVLEKIDYLFNIY